MRRNHFDRLSAELITQILLELPTTQSLYSLIRASPKAYQVFLASKEMILVSLMRRTISPAAFIDALAAVQASQLKDKGPDRKQVLDFLRKYEIKRHKNIEAKECHYSLTTTVSLCQLYRSSQFFIKRLTSRSKFYLRRCRDSLRPVAIDLVSLCITKRESSVDRDRLNAPLSEVEEGRLQRAFYRYELYTQIFSTGMEYKGEKLWELPSDSHFFLDNYQHGEIEELACVENYLWSQLSSSFDRIECSFEGTQLPERPLDDTKITDYQSYKRSVALREAKFKIHSLYVDDLMSLSLPFLHHALQLDRQNMQREMSSHICYDGQKRSLSTALGGYWKFVSRKEGNLIRKYGHAVARSKTFDFKDTVDGPNEGWLSVYSNTQRVPLYGIRDTIHSLGYVFWDSQRLRDCNFMVSLLAGLEERCRIKTNVVPATGRTPFEALR